MTYMDYWREAHEYVYGKYGNTPEKEILLRALSRTLGDYRATVPADDKVLVFMEFVDEMLHYLAEK